MYEGPGIYRHYKGGYYRVIGIAEHESTGKRTVVYHSYSIEHDLSRAVRGINFVNRPLNEDDGDDAWNQMVDGPELAIGRPEKVARFVKLRVDTFHMTGA